MRRGDSRDARRGGRRGDSRDRRRSRRDDSRDRRGGGREVPPPGGRGDSRGRRGKRGYERSRSRDGGEQNAESMALVPTDAAPRERKSKRGGWDPEPQAMMLVNPGQTPHPANPGNQFVPPSAEFSGPGGASAAYQGVDCVHRSFDVDPKHVQTIVGKFLWQVEMACRGAFVHVDDRSDDKAVVKINGPAPLVEKAEAMVRVRLAGMTDDPSSLPPGYFMETLCIQPNQVGSIVGTGGDLLREVQTMSGAQVTINNNEQDCKCCIVGTREAVDIALKFIKQRIGYFLDIKVEQGKVGAIIGPKGITFKEIKNTTGATIWIDQSTQNEGWSLVRIKDPGTEKHEAAKQMIFDLLGPDALVEILGERSGHAATTEGMAAAAAAWQNFGSADGGLSAPSYTIDYDRNGEMKWRCGACNFTNKKNNTVCGGTGPLGCKRPRPDELGGPGPAPEADKRKQRQDWVCPSCKDLQFARNLKCRRCGCPNPNDGSSPASGMITSVPEVPWQPRGNSSTYAPEVWQPRDPPHFGGGGKGGQPQPRIVTSIRDQPPPQPRIVTSIRDQPRGNSNTIPPSLMDTPPPTPKPVAPTPALSAGQMKSWLSDTFSSDGSAILPQRGSAAVEGTPEVSAESILAMAMGGGGSMML